MRMILRVVGDPAVNLDRLPGEGEVASCSKDTSHAAQLMGSKDMREARDAAYGQRSRREEYAAGTHLPWVASSTAPGPRATGAPLPFPGGLQGLQSKEGGAKMVTGHFDSNQQKDSGFIENETRDKVGLFVLIGGMRSFTEDRYFMGCGNRIYLQRVRGPRDTGRRCGSCLEVHIVSRDQVVHPF